jgi:cytochrome c553
MKYTRILGVAAALLVSSAVASQAATPAPPAAPTAPPATTAGAPAASAPVTNPAVAGTSAQATAPSVQPATVQPAADPAAAPVTALADDKPATWGDPKAGQTKAGTCAACHGADGNSADAQYPRLAGQHERYIARQLHLFKTGERENPIMAPMAASLSAQDMRDIGAYFATQKGAAGVADESPVPAGGPHAGEKFWQVGERVFRAGNAKAGVPACLACHGPVGRGNPGPAYPNVGGQHAAYTTARMNYFRAGSDKAKATSPAMVDIAARLTDEEIQGLATYVEGLHHVAVAKKAE